MLIEGGFAWLPALMWRLDRAWRRLRAEAPLLDRPPSELIRERFCVSTQPMEETERPEQFPELLEQLDMDDRIMFSTDYPHWDFDAPDMALPVRLPAGAAAQDPARQRRAPVRARRARRCLSAVARVVVGSVERAAARARGASSRSTGRSIGVFNVGGEYLAIRNRCPHQGGPLCEGVQLGELTSDGPGDYRYDAARRDHPLPVARLGVRPAHGRVVVRPRAQARALLRRRGASTRPSSATRCRRGPGMVRGPYTAETVPVAVEGRLVVVDVGG